GPSPPIPQRIWSPPCRRSSAFPSTGGASSGPWRERKKTTLAMARHDCPADRTDSSEQVTRYEDLRRHVIDNGGGHRLGLALFHREGMKAWLDAWSTCASGGARPLPNTSDDPVRSLPLTGDVGAV